MAPQTGAIEVTSVTAGEPTDPDGYTLTVDGVAGAALGTTATLTIPDLSAGNHELMLGGMASNCVLMGPNPRTATVSRGATAHAIFELTCSAATGSIEVTTVTTGESLDPDGYLATLDGAPGRPVPSNGTIAFTAVTAGSHTVILTGSAPNCAVVGDNPRTVAVGSGAVTTTFEVTCGPPAGLILISTTTGGVHLDPDGYAASVDGGAEQAIGTNGTLTLSGVLVGAHTVQLSGVAANCTVGGDNPLTITVTNGATAPAAFQVSCYSTGTGRILFASDRTGTNHLYSMREDGSDIVDLTPSMDAYDGDWSPDGSQIVFVGVQNQDEGIFVMDADGSNPVSLGIAGGGPRWSPDGRQIVFVSGGGTFSTDPTIQVMNADGTGVTALTTGRSPDWSPDGASIAFSRTRACVVDLPCSREIYLMAADGTQVRKLVSSSSPWESLTVPAWSPDGTKIVYTRRCCLFTSSENGLYAITLASGSVARIDARHVDGRAVWSPDGSAIAFPAGQPDATTELTMIPSSGGAGTVLASSPGREYPVSWK